MVGRFDSEMVTAPPTPGGTTTVEVIGSLAVAVGPDDADPPAGGIEAVKVVNIPVVT